MLICMSLSADVYVIRWCWCVVCHMTMLMCDMCDDIWCHLILMYAVPASSEVSTIDIRSKISSPYTRMMRHMRERYTTHKSDSGMIYLCWDIVALLPATGIVSHYSRWYYRKYHYKTVLPNQYNASLPRYHTHVVVLLDISYVSCSMQVLLQTNLHCISVILHTTVISWR